MMMMMMTKCLEGYIENSRNWDNGQYYRRTAYKKILLLDWTMWWTDDCHLQWAEMWHFNEVITQCNQLSRIFARIRQVTPHAEFE